MWEVYNLKVKWRLFLNQAKIELIPRQEVMFARFMN